MAEIVAADMVNLSKFSKNDQAFLKQLSETPYGFDFFQTVRRLECIYGRQVGVSNKPIDDPVRLVHEALIGFAPSTIGSYRPAKNGKKPHLGSYFLGLLGPQGPLPMHLTEYAHERKIHSHDETFVQFLDLFHHRMLSFFYRAWANNQPVVNLDRLGPDRFKTYTGSFFGIGDSAFHERDELPDNTKLYSSGHLSCQTKHVQGLECLITSYFKIPVKIKEFVGEWILLPEDNICQLGLGRDVNTLGENVIVGKRIWEAQQKFRIVFGPLNFENYKKFLPGKEFLKVLVAMVRNYTGDLFNWDIQLILKKEEVPGFEINASLQLGYTTWAVSEIKETDADELIFTPIIN